MKSKTQTAPTKGPIPTGWRYAEVGEQLSGSTMFWNDYGKEWQQSRAVLHPDNHLMKCNQSFSFIVPINAQTAPATAAHTPGPWTTKPTASLGPQYAVYPETDGPDIAIVYDHGNTEANARLIAAAPELLAALDPDILEAIAEEISEANQFLNSARAHTLRVLAKHQRAALDKARQ